MKPELEALLEHSGVKGMKWGVRKDKHKGKLRTHVDSIKREHSWGKKLRESDNMSTKDIQKLASRAQLESDFKRLSKKTNVGSAKSKKDYLKRADMDDKELLRKVQRLRAKDQLDRNANEITKQHREMAKKIVQVAAPLAIKYALTGRISKADLIAAALATGGGKVKMVKTAMDETNKVKKQGNGTKHSDELADVILHSLKPSEIVQLLIHGYADDDIVELDVLQHAGVKGMKWGVIRKKIQTAGRAHNRKRSEKIKAANAKFHEKRKNKPRYKRIYNAQLKRNKGNHEKTVSQIRSATARTNRTLLINGAIAASPFIKAAGKTVVRKAAKMASDPANIRRGKNIIQAIKRSPIRYVDGKAMTNVVGTIF